MQDTITEFETVEVEREVTEVVTDYKTDEKTYEILRCDTCEKSLGELDDPDPHAKVAFNPSIKNGKVTRYSDLVDEMEQAILDTMNTMKLEDRRTISIDGWKITPRKNMTASDIAWADYGFGSPPVNLRRSRSPLTDPRTPSVGRTPPPPVKEEELLLVIDDDIKDCIRRINFSEFIEVPDPEVHCDVSLDLCPGCAEGMGATVNQGNATLVERDESTESITDYSHVELDTATTLFILTCGASLGAALMSINIWLFAIATFVTIIASTLVELRR